MGGSPRDGQARREPGGKLQKIASLHNSERFGQMNSESERESHSPPARIYSRTQLAAVLLIAGGLSREMPPKGIGRAIANAGTLNASQIRTNHEEEPLNQAYCICHLPTIYPMAVHFWDSARLYSELDQYRRRELERGDELGSESGSGGWRHSDNHEGGQLHCQHGRQLLSFRQDSIGRLRRRPNAGDVRQSNCMQRNDHGWQRWVADCVAGVFASATN